MAALHRFSIALACAGVMSAGLLACGPEPTDFSQVTRRSMGALSEVAIWRDAQTGCEYVIYDGYREGGITPRMRADGTQVCEAAQ